MPEFYTKAVKLPSGSTYAVGGGGTGYTSIYFPNGASALDTFNAFMLVPKTVNQNITSRPDCEIFGVFSNSTGGVTFSLGPQTVYPYRLRVLGFSSANYDIMGLA